MLAGGYLSYKDEGGDPVNWLKPVPDYMETSWRVKEEVQHILCQT